MTTTTTASSMSATGKAAPLAALDELLVLPAHELETMYRRARVPKIADVRGDLRGRMLAWPSLDGHPRVARALRGLAGASSFPWRGKSFVPEGDDRGAGSNRVFSDRLRLFRFETFVGKSRAGDFDAVQLDYDLAGNPFVIRRIKDEIREIDRGLWLGQAYFVTRTRAVLWLYFGLSVRA